MDKTKVRLEILGLSSGHAQSGSFALVLEEAEGKRRLPIIIGMFEAQAIAIELEKMASSRPMTHDLFKSFAKAFHFTISEIIITNLKEGIFYARIVCQDHEGKTIEIDSRPSDAIAIGLRFKVPISVYEFVLQEAGIIIQETEEGEEIAEETENQTKEPNVESKDSIKDLSLDDLQKLLQEAIEDENYEKAAKLRDEIGRRKQK